MTNIPELVAPYVTLANAETILSGDTDWDAASEDEQNEALSYGRQYMVKNYVVAMFDEDDAPSEVQYGNCLFAVEFLQGDLFTAPDANVGKETLKAGSVTVMTEFTRAPESTSIVDPFPQISSVIYEYFKWKTGGVVAVNLVRA